MGFRRAIVDDIVELCMLMKETGIKENKALARAISYCNGNPLKKQILVVDDGSQLLAYAGMKKTEEDEKACKFIDLETHACLTWIGVKEDYWGKGIGSSLLLECDELAREWGKIGIWLDCGKKRASFYLDNGYEIVGEYRRSGKTKFVMEKLF